MKARLFFFLIFSQSQSVLADLNDEFDVYYPLNSKSSTIINESFDDNHLDEDWSVSYKNSEGWVYMEAEGRLLVSDITDTIRGEWASVVLSRQFEPITDFNLSFDFGWDSEKNYAPVQKVGVQLNSKSGKVISVAYLDEWYSSAGTGSRYAVIGADYYQSDSNSLPVSGEAQVQVIRKTDSIDILWDGVSIFTGSNGDDITSLSLVFAYSWKTSASFFGSEHIDKVILEGTEKKGSPQIDAFTASPVAGNPPLTVNFDVKASDPGGSINKYQWFFGDKSKEVTTTGKTSHTYYDIGKYKARVIVKDDQGAKSKSKKLTINVQHGPELMGKVKSYRFDDETNTIGLDFEVSNAGNIPTSPFAVTFNLSNNGKKVASTFKEESIDTLGVGESKTISFEHTFDDSIYGQYILILVDPTKKVAEVDETNNGTQIVIMPLTTK